VLAGSWEIWGTRIEETAGPGIFGGTEQRSGGLGDLGVEHEEAEYTIFRFRIQSSSRL